MPRIFLAMALTCLAATVPVATAQSHGQGGVISAPPVPFTKKTEPTVDSTLSLVSLGNPTKDSLLTLNQPTGGGTEPGTTSGSPSGGALPAPPPVGFRWAMIETASYGGSGGMGQMYHTCAWNQPTEADIGNNFNAGVCSAGISGKRYYCSDLVPQSHDDLQDYTFKCTDQ